MIVKKIAGLASFNPYHQRNRVHVAICAMGMDCDVSSIKYVKEIYRSGNRSRTVDVEGHISRDCHFFLT